MKEKKRLDVKVVVVAVVLITILVLYLIDYPAEKETIELSEIHIAACELADEAGTCDTRLPDLGIVLQEECCQVLGKCCG